MAFCSNCGGKIEDGVKFCGKCGNAVRSDSTGDVQPTNQTNYSPGVQVVAETAKKDELKSLKILSIIGFIVFPLGLFSFYGISDEETFWGCIFTYFGYALTYSIVALVKGRKNALKATGVMAILGIIVSIASPIFAVSSMYYDFEATQGWTSIGMLYALTLAIVAFVQVRKK